MKLKRLNAARDAKPQGCGGVRNGQCAQVVLSSRSSVPGGVPTQKVVREELGRHLLKAIISPLNLAMLGITN